MSVFGRLGAKGGYSKVVDIEYSWTRSHHDLAKAYQDGVYLKVGTPVDPFANANHGTGVLGVLVATDNSFGVTGLVPNANVGVVNAASAEYGWAPELAIERASKSMQRGDVLLLEQQAYVGDRYGPVESYGYIYDAIVVAVGRGIIVVEAAGNGGANVDGLLPTGRPDSGAIMVGAGSAPCNPAVPLHSRLSFSNFGSRLNMQGYGECVTTAGYGDLTPSLGPRDWYTAWFGGTSSASAIVAGAAASFSSAFEARRGVPPTPQKVRDVLVATGTPQPSPNTQGRIGPLPNLPAAMNRI